MGNIKLWVFVLVAIITSDHATKADVEQADQVQVDAVQADQYQADRQDRRR